MNVDAIPPNELQKLLRLAHDIVMAHRVARGLSLSRERVTWARDTIEQRVTDALRGVDFERMPPGWSWQKAAQEISVQVALAIVHAQKLEPPESSDQV
ncbi:hypothetical protein [Hydrogenophaga sp. T2]|uniref:hypothetical protein n=1 Tax=Hydrogenophaga sp. T2 TaxID=3132823 RepID=UPI003CF37005